MSLLLLAALLNPAQQPQPAYDLLISGGMVLDGTGGPAFRADVAVRGDRIALVSRRAIPRARARKVINAAGHMVSPGFIDLHAHNEPVFSLPDATSRVRQGVTTTLGGPDGGGPWPFGEYLERAEKLPLGINIGWLTGFGSIRQAVLGGNAAVGSAPVAMVVTGVMGRSSWRYRERGYRRVLLDSGHLLGNAGLVAPALGLEARMTAAFDDGRIERLLRLESDDEGALAVVALAEPGPEPRPAWTALPSGTGAGDPAPPLHLALHRASRLGATRPALLPRGDGQSAELADRYGARGGIDCARPPDDERLLADEVLSQILARRSTRAYRRASMRLEQLQRILMDAYAPERSGLGAQPGFDRDELATFVAVVAVDGLEPGVYYLEPSQPALRLLRAGCRREDLRFLCLGQELGGDACCVVFHAADLPRAVRRMGDRAYRHLHLDAGMIGQRLNLAALAEGLGASGIGGFFDEHVNALLGVPAEQAAVYVTTIGVPAAPR